MQAARRLFDQIKNNRAGRQTGLCFTAVLGLLFLVGSLRYHGDAAGHNSAQQQRKFLDQNKSFCPGPVTEPLKRPDSWWEPFSQKLAAEVAASDALQVTVILSESVHHFGLREACDLCFAFRALAWSSMVIV